MLILRNPIEQPWAFAVKANVSLPTGVRFQYHTTRAEAEKARDRRLANKRHAGPVEYRPGECHIVGAA